MSQADLAAAVGVTGVCVSLWERAQRTPAEEHWVQLELTLGPLGIVREAKPEAARGTADAA
jgi:ribosome-binding protein aMBF1 (putative translation factor)